MQYETILYSEKDHIGLLTLNRPETLNALNQKMIEELDALLDEVYRTIRVRVLVVTGSGEKGFCSGMDVRGCPAQLFEASAADDLHVSKSGFAVVLQNEIDPQPVIAAVQVRRPGQGSALPWHQTCG